MNGEQSIGAAFLDSEGRATFTAAALPTGEQKITAVYEGDGNFEASNSAPAVVNSAASGVPGFTLTASNASLSVAAGNTATTVLTATPENGFNQAVSLSCSGVPYATVTCVFSPSQVTPGAATPTAPNGTPAISTLSILTTAPSGTAMLRDAPRSRRRDSLWIGCARNPGPGRAGPRAQTRPLWQSRERGERDGTTAPSARRWNGPEFLFAAV